MNDFKRLSILLVEDEEDLRRETASFLEIYCGRVIRAANGREALTLFNELRPDIVISDIRMPLMDGLELAVHLKRQAPETPVIFCTAFTDTPYLLKAIELGVSAFVRKPADTDELLAAIDKAALPLLQRIEIRELSDQLTASLTAYLGAGPTLKSLSEQVARVAHTSFNILLQGETGSGKSYLANIIHSISPRRDGPFVSAQMAAIPEQLAESELFGYVKGAFTGATHTRRGLVETAYGGTLFLDDIESCSLPIQAKLLRFVEEKRFTPVGSAAEKSGDVRIIAASNRNLKQEVPDGRFREDLFYRLSDFIISLPPLREMRDTVVPLSLKFLQETCNELGRDIPFIDDEARALLTANDWPGNIRRLKSVIRRAALLADNTINGAVIAAAFGDIIDTPHLQAEDCTVAPAPPPFPCSMDTLEKWSLEEALRFCGGKRMKAAAMLGMNYYTFRRKLEKHGIAVDKEQADDRTDDHI
jgi:DNA-binding NtrC family response regulator